MFEDLKYNNTNHEQDYDMYGKPLADAAKIGDPVIKFARPVYVKRSGEYIPEGVQFYRPEHDLPTIANAVALDGILNRSVAIYVEQIMKNGFEFVSKSDRIQKHANKRIREIELGTNIKFTEVVSTIAHQLVQYGTAYLIKVRKQSKVGKKYKLYNRTVKPVVGLFVVDATTMEIGLNTNQKVSHYRQVLNGQYKVYSVEDVIHFNYNKVPGELTGRSNINQVLDDVRALRKLEEEVEILGFQYAIPLYLYKVGTDSHPAAPGEVDSVGNTINHMPTYGMMCVPHTHTMEAVSQSNANIDIMPFISHFKSRINSGLGVSDVAMGQSDTSNRNTSEIQDLSMQTITKAYQQILKNKLDLELFKELMLDGGVNPMAFDLELRFPEIDQEAQIKKETHVVQKYQGNLITRTEARLEIDMEINVDEEDLHINNVQIPLIEAEVSGQLEVQEPALQSQEKLAKISAAAKPTTTASGGRSKSSGTKAKAKTKKSTKSTTSKSQPSNQSGKQLSRPKIKRDFMDSLSGYADSIGSIFLDNNAYKSDINRSTYLKSIKSNIKSNVTEYLKYTIKDYSEYYHVDGNLDTITISNEITDFVMITVEDKIKRLGRLKSTESSNIVRYTLDSIQNDIDCEERIDNYVRAHFLKNMGYTSVLYNSDECMLHSDYNIDIEKITIATVPPLKYGCTCKIKDHTDGDS